MAARSAAGTRGWDPAMLAVAAATLAVVAVVATIVPAGRAVRLDPAVALRED